MLQQIFFLTDESLIGLQDEIIKIAITNLGFTPLPSINVINQIITSGEYKNE